MLAPRYTHSNFFIQAPNIKIKNKFKCVIMYSLSDIMAASKTDRRLQHLAKSKSCSYETAARHAEELKKLANKGMSFVDSEAKSKVFKALSDPIRLRILGLISSREMCVCEIMVALELTQPTASHHLRILENVGLVKDRKEEKWVFYSITNPELFEGLHKLNIF
jgi:ArsR family transcriptional regulator, arsenate/arsenite/antimonite-responsive transcriptional repressor